MHRNQSGTPHRLNLNLPVLRRVSAIIFLVGASLSATYAQQPVASGNVQLLASLSDKPLDLANVGGLNYSSSTSNTLSSASDSARRGLSAAELQPQQSRTFGPPHHNGNWQNADGSNKYGLVLGAGMTEPIGNTHHYLNTSFGLELGVARNFSQSFGVVAQYDYDRFGFNGSTLASQQALYNYCPSRLPVGTCALNTISNLDGNSHIWSVSLNPTYSFFNKQSVGAYVVAGAGFYHKVANFTLPNNACADIYCYYQYTASQSIDHYMSNAPGFSGGFGLTYKVSHFSSARVFAEARYIFIDNFHRFGLTTSNINTTAGQTYYNANGSNFYPANSNRTSYATFKAGLRF